VPSPWWASILPPTHRCGRHRTGIIIACGQNIPDAQRLTGHRTWFGSGEKSAASG
jgi:hypothetical protein